MQFVVLSKTEKYIVKGEKSFGLKIAPKKKKKPVEKFMYFLDWFFTSDLLKIKNYFFFTSDLFFIGDLII